MGKSLNQEKLLEILVLAYTYDCEKLKKAVRTFLFANPEARYFVNLTLSKEWIDFMISNREMASEIVKDVFMKINFKRR